MMFKDDEENFSLAVKGKTEVKRSGGCPFMKDMSKSEVLCFSQN